MAGVGVQVFGAKEVSRKLRKIERNVKNKAGLHGLWATSTFKWTIKNFESEGVKGGEAWKPLLPATLAARRRGRGRGSAKILQDFGQLRQSFHPVSNSRLSKVASNKIYAATHQFGRKKANIPPRPILPVRFSLIKDMIEKRTLQFIRSERITGRI